MSIAGWTTQLSDWVTPTSMPSDTIYLQEAMDDFATSDMRMSQNQNSAAVMAFYTNWNAITDPTLFNILYRSIVGGWDPVANVRQAPMAHPYFAGMYAKDFMSVKGVAGDVTQTGVVAGHAAYTAALIVVNFETFSYYPAGDSSFIPNWLEVLPMSSVQRITLPGNMYIFSDGSQAQAGTYVNQRIQFIRMIAHQCPEDLVFSGTGDLELSFDDQIGTVNSTTFLGYTESTMLLNGARALPPYGIPDSAGTHIYDVELDFIFNQYTWQDSVKPDGTWAGITYAGSSGATKPFVETDLNDVLTALDIA